MRLFGYKLIPQRIADSTEEGKFIFVHDHTQLAVADDRLPILHEPSILLLRGAFYDKIKENHAIQIIRDPASPEISTKQLKFEVPGEEIPKPERIREIGTKLAEELLAEMQKGEVVRLHNLTTLLHASGSSSVRRFFVRGVFA